MSEPEINKDHGSTVYLTPEGHKVLQEELDYLTSVKRPEIADRLRESQGHGEFSEDNSELDEVKGEQAMVEGRIAELKIAFANMQILEPDQIPDSYVGIGSYAKVLDLDWDDEFEIQLLSSIESDPSKDSISIESPMGQAIYGHKPNEEFTFSAPDGKKRYKVVSIRK